MRSFGSHSEEIEGRKKSLSEGSGGKMTASEGVWRQNEGYWGLNLVYLLLDASYMEPDEGKRRASVGL